MEIKDDTKVEEICPRIKEIEFMEIRLLLGIYLDKKRDVVIPSYEYYSRGIEKIYEYKSEKEINYEEIEEFLERKRGCGKRHHDLMFVNTDDIIKYRNDFAKVVRIGVNINTTDKIEHGKICAMKENSIKLIDNNYFYDNFTEIFIMKFCG